MSGGGVSYKFRGIDQVYEALHPLMIKHGVFMTAEVIEKSREERTTIKRDERYGDKTTVSAFTCLHMRYHFVAADGSSVYTEAEGEGMDSGDKSSNKAMAAAHKYAILQAFCVPTEATDDPDAEVHEVTPRPATTRPAQAPKLQMTEEQKALKDALDRVMTAMNAATTPALVDAIMAQDTKVEGQTTLADIKEKWQKGYDALLKAAEVRKRALA